MSGAVVLLLGVIGLLVGSAVWAIAASQAAQRPLLSGPACASCSTPLPVVAWLPLHGFGRARRCRTCGVEQPIARVLFELGVAGYFAFVAARSEGGVSLAATLVFTVPLLVILLVDWWTRYIHTNIIGLGLLLGFGFALVDGVGTLLNHLLATGVALLAFGFFFALAAGIYRNIAVVPFGRGDVYLAAVIGAMTGWPDVATALFYGMIFGGGGAVLLLVTRRAGRRDAVAYGPYLCIGALVVLLIRV
ncbi:MAG: A24 family peptidase [Chloroflexota bacterium]|nr:A24 family peptidase [Chloroflexota bacterium]